jgi:outer membrane protein TolC
MNLWKYGVGRPRIPAYILFLCVFLYAAPSAFGQEKQKLTPDEAVELAIRNNLGLQSARIGVETQRRQSSLSWNQFIPTVGIGGTLSRLGQKPVESVLPLSALGIAGLEDIVMGGGYQWSAAGSLGISLNLNAAMFENMKTLRLQYEGGSLSYEKAKAQMEQQVRKGYYSLLLLQEQIALQRQSLANDERQVEIARANYRAGRSAELVLLQAQVNLENHKPVIDELENSFKVYMATFAQILGHSYDTEFELTPVDGNATFITLDVKDLVSKAAAGDSLDIQEIKQSILSIQSQRKMTRLTVYTPTLSLGWTKSPSFLLDPMKDSWFNGRNWEDPNRGVLSLGLSFNLDNLVPFGSRAQNLDALDDQLASYTIQLTDAIRGTEVQIYNTILSLEKSRTDAEAQSATVELAQRTYNLTMDAYRAGLSDVQAIQDVELGLRQARLGVLSANYNYMMGLIDLEYYIGVPFGTLTKGKQ